MLFMNHLQLYFDKNSLTFKKDGQELSNLVLPPQIIKNQEVVETGLLDKTLTNFFSTNKLVKGTATLVIGDEYIFTKTLLLTDAQDTNFEKDKFLSDIPFDPPNLAVQTTTDETQLTLYAVNKHLFYPFVHLLEKFGWVITIVSPVVAIEKVNFLDQATPRKLSHSKIILIATLFLALLAVGLGVFFFLRQPAPPPPKTPATIPTVVSTPTPLPTPAFKETNSLNAIIYNIIQKNGETTKATKILQDLGLEDIKVENLKKQAETTRLLIGPEVATQSTEKIYSALKVSFPKIEIAATSEGKFDIIIIIGK